MNIKQYLENCEVELTDQLTGEQKTVFYQWVTDDAGCDLIHFYDENEISDELEALLWQLQYCKCAQYQLEKLEEEAEIGRSVKLIACLLRSN